MDRSVSCTVMWHGSSKDWGYVLDECLSNAAASMQSHRLMINRERRGVKHDEIDIQEWPVSIDQESVPSSNQPGSLILGWSCISITIVGLAAALELVKAHRSRIRTSHTT